MLIISCEKERSEQQILQLNKIILEEYFIKAIEFDTKGNAWIGTFKQGLIKYNSGEITIFNASNSVISDTTVIYDIEVDSKNQVWIGEYGLIKYDGQNFIRYNSENSDIPEDFISVIEIDSRDHVWFSSSRFRQGGMVKYDGNEFKVFSPENSELPAHLIAGIAISSDDDVWVALNEVVDSSCLVKISGEEWTIYTYQELGFKPYYFSDITMNSQNQLVGGIDYSLSSVYFPEGPQVFVFDGNSSMQYTSEARFSNVSVFVDREDQIWCGTYEGLFLLDKDKKIRQLEFLKLDGIYCINQHPNGELWVGTSKGIFIFKVL